MSENHFFDLPPAAWHEYETLDVVDRVTVPF
jgi:hypothetical protein